jgi:hypothetical protein
VLLTEYRYSFLTRTLAEYLLDNAVISTGGLVPGRFAQSSELNPMLISENAAVIHGIDHNDPAVVCHISCCFPLIKRFVRYCVSYPFTYWVSIQTVERRAQ